MKKIMLVACMFMLGMIASAKADDTTSTVTVDPIGVNLSDIVKSARIGAFYAMYPRGMTLACAYTPLVSFHTTDATEIANLNIGGVINADDTTHGSPYTGIGLRLDSVLAKTFSGTWSKTHISTASLPTMELMLGTTWYSPTHEWLIGPSLAIKF